MPSRRVEITVPEETFDRIEAARGDVPRAAWIKRALESALDPTVIEVGGEHPAVSRIAEAARRAPRSSAAKAGVKPIPKGGR